VPASPAPWTTSESAIRPSTSTCLALPLHEPEGFPMDGYGPWSRRELDGAETRSKDTTIFSRGAAAKRGKARAHAANDMPANRGDPVERRLAWRRPSRSGVGIIATGCHGHRPIRGRAPTYRWGCALLVAVLEALIEHTDPSPDSPAHSGPPVPGHHNDHGGG
jgi:hypothetical protein